MQMVLRVFCLALFNALIIGGLCQTIPSSPNKIDEYNKRVGTWTILYDKNWNKVNIPDSATYYRIINFKNGKPDGKVTDYYLSGTKQWEGFLYSFKPDSSYGHAIY